MGLFSSGLVIVIVPLRLMISGAFPHKSDVQTLASPDSISSWLISYQGNRLIPLL